jgi:hypothetical protein
VYNPCYCDIEGTECLLLTACYPTTIIDLILNLHIQIITLKCSDYLQNLVVTRFVGTVTYSYASRSQVLRNNCVFSEIFFYLPFLLHFLQLLFTLALDVSILVLLHMCKFEQASVRIAYVFNLF